MSYYHLAQKSSLLLFYKRSEYHKEKPIIRPLALLFNPHDTAKTEMTSRGVDGLRHARSGTIAAAVIRRAQMRPALHHFAWDADVRQVGIVTFFFVSALRVEA